MAGTLRGGHPGDCSITRDYGSLVRVTFRYFASPVDLLSTSERRAFFDSRVIYRVASRIQKLDRITWQDDVAIESVRLGLNRVLSARPTDRGSPEASLGHPVAIFTYQIACLTSIFASPQVDTPNFAGDRLG
jgi:hypothetical protein